MIRRSARLIATACAALPLVSVSLMSGCESTSSRDSSSSATAPEGAMIKGVVTPDQALARLKAGNERFVAQKSKHPRSDRARVALTGTDGQYPFASILSCADSRVPVELVFDEGVGDTFVVRVAGNVAGTNETASLEFGVAALGTNLLVVMGHSACGAVNAVASDAQLFGSLPQLAGEIRPAVQQARANNRGLSAELFLPKAIESNVMHQIADLLTTSPTMADGVRNGTLKIVGAVYDLNTGKVQWLGEHPDQARVLGM